MNKTKARKYAEFIAEQLTSYMKNWEDEEMTLEEYLKDNCGYWFIVDQNGDFNSVIIYVTVGGPRCYIDTWEGQIVCSWGFDRERVNLDWEVVCEINRYYEMIYKAERECW